MDGKDEGVILPEAPTSAPEAEVIGETTWGVIRALWSRGRNKKQIARELGLDVKTVRKHLNHAWVVQKRRPRGRLLDDFRAFLEGRAPEVGFNGEVLLREVRGLGYRGSYSTLAEYIAPWRRAWRSELEPAVRFETDPGEQSQVDWGSTNVWLSEERVRVHIFTMILGYSRRIFARAYRGERLEWLLEAHERAFFHLGGRTETILYDNPRTIVLSKDEKAGTVAWNTTFKDRMDFYGVEVKLCRYYRAQTKGKVESGVKYVKRNALAGKRFRDLAELNAYLLDWCVTVADQRVHGTTHERPQERFERAEKLIPVDARKPAPHERVVFRIVPRDAYVAVEANRYPVPFEWIGQRITVRILSEEVVFSADGQEPLTHPRLSGKHALAPWRGERRRLKRQVLSVVDAPPRFDPMLLERIGSVEPRPLSAYESVVSEVRG